ncbi:MAG: PEP-CTERM sorting domain-containing protein [Deltaproteobacteria bacterium]|nr:PEP-CTERM sorting domain-containing protein [Candidatus Anaeroferrophillus wilburensis]
MAMGMLLVWAQASQAVPQETPFVLDSSWTVFAVDEGVDAGGRVYPGWGGQDFDAEYLAYCYDAGTSRLSIALQTGFNVRTGTQTYNSKDYYAGDLALSFDGNDDNYEYGVGFGFAGLTAAGFYSNTTWLAPDDFPVSTPYRIDSSASSSALLANSGSYNSGADTFWRYVTFSVVGFDLSQGFDAHWTMSCGNDVIEGHAAPVPEPQTLLLMGIGCLGLVMVARRQRQEK